MTRPRPAGFAGHGPRRQYLTPREWDAMLEGQGGACACGCGRTPEDAPFEADHSTPDWFRRGEKPNQLLARPCHRAKTRRDRKAIAKTKHILGLSKNGPKRKIAAHSDPWRRKFREQTGFKWKWPEGRKIQGRRNREWPRRTRTAERGPPGNRTAAICQ